LACRCWHSSHRDRSALRRSQCPLDLPHLRLVVEAELSDGSATDVGDAGVLKLVDSLLDPFRVLALPVVAERIDEPITVPILGRIIL
jgi:hypothetical protein